MCVNSVFIQVMRDGWRGQTDLIMLLISFLSTDGYISLRAEVVDEFNLGCVVSFERAEVDLAESLAG
jgi:hypothetical protein